MAYTSEIEKLEKRWAENPKGRNFAPLADAYRKAGELDRAIELCKAGLDLHPDYVSAHIVFARCLIDQKNDAGASDVFRKVLTLDPENVLGLKMLADIAERSGRYDEAVEWLTRLLSADPMNGDAAEHLARAKGRAAAQAASAKPTTPMPAVQVPEPVVRLVPPPSPTASVPRAAEPPTAPTPKPEFVVEHASDVPAAPDLTVKGPPQDIETFDGTLDFNAVAHQGARADGLEVQEEVKLEAQNLEVEGLARTQYDSGMFAPPPEDELPTIDLPLIMPDDLAPLPEAEPAPPVAAAQRAPAAPGGAGSAPGTPSSPPPAAVALSDDDGAADTATLSRAEPVLTETMAELYLRQGHQEDALRVYQALLAQRPGDARLAARVEALSPGGRRERRRGTGESLPSFLNRILTGRPGAPAPAPAPSPPSPPPPAAALGESPLESAFSLTSFEPEPGPDITAPGAATRPAADSISLDAVFGEESPHSAPPGPEPAPPGAPATPPPAPQQTGGFSFDQFFSAPAGSPPAAAGAPPKAPTRPSGPKPLPAEDEGDLDQFQSWLKGLKS